MLVYDVPNLGSLFHLDDWLEEIYMVSRGVLHLSG